MYFLVFLALAWKTHGPPLKRMSWHGAHTYVLCFFLFARGSADSKMSHWRFHDLYILTSRHHQSRVGDHQSHVSRQIGNMTTAILSPSGISDQHAAKDALSSRSMRRPLWTNRSRPLWASCSFRLIRSRKSCPVNSDKSSGTLTSCTLPLKLTTSALMLAQFATCATGRAWAKMAVG